MKRIAIENDVIVAAYRETRSIKATAERLGMTASTVDKRLTQSGVERIGQRGVPRKLPPNIVDEYNAGMSMNAIARKYSCCLPTVAEALHRAGFTARRRGGQRKEIQREVRDEMARLYSEHKSIARVSSLMDKSISCVTRNLQMLGVVDRRPQGARHRSWKGGRHVTKEGYSQVFVAENDPLRCMAQVGGYVPEHRLVVARLLGRPLERHESVHHINGQRTDNRIENLQLRQGHHGAGVVHRCRACGSADIETTRLN